VTELELAQAGRRFEDILPFMNGHRLHLLSSKHRTLANDFNDSAVMGLALSSFKGATWKGAVWKRGKLQRKSIIQKSY
jgi:hypothetical protein